jgi:hypothetical protein
VSMRPRSIARSANSGWDSPPPGGSNCKRGNNGPWLIAAARFPVVPVQSLIHRGTILGLFSAVYCRFVPYSPI